IRHARGTDFADTPTDKVGIGTVIDMQDLSGGSMETVTILGAWDGDTEKNIISYLSESAKALIGRVIGDEVDIPADTAHGSRRVKVLAIRPFQTAVAAPSS
ncbi:MAG: GreA/GreB family elongation factor, partial [Verrucomicrobiaceae bacterium]|nr:GreA/GreB family elongation factor [Verrucomicrobiaceae bacterium]